MKCTNNSIKLLLPVFFCVIFLAGCGKNEYTIPYDINSPVTAFSFETSDKDSVADAFATNLCVVSDDMITGEDMEGYGSAALFDINNKNVIFSKNANTKMYPASMTKVMTALLAIKYGNAEDKLTASDHVLIKESGAQLCGFKPGDTITLDQALHGLLMYSGNDVAVMIAEYISGSVEEFAKLMNTEAAQLGATNTNFVNPNGLHDEKHYSTAYDMYLIFNEAMKYDYFVELIHTSNYTTSYTNSAGETINDTYNTTNLYLKEEVSAPANVTVIGGKTGTTNSAGTNLILLSKDTSGNPYISIVMKSKDRDTLYAKMTNLLESIGN